MASRIRTALLTTAVASGLLLTNVPAQAQVADGDVATQLSETVTTEALTPTPSDLAEDVVAGHGSDLADPLAEGLDVPAVEFETRKTTENDIAAAIASGDEEGDETEKPSAPTESMLPSDISPTPQDLPDESDLTDVHGLHEESSESVSAHDETVVTPEVSMEAVSPVTESAEAAIESAESTEATIEESDEPTSFWEVVEGIEAPEGSESWSEEEWVDFLETPEGNEFTDQVLDGLVGTEEFDTIVDILADFIESGDETYLDDLMDYFLDLFDGNEEWAMEAYNGIIQELINEGLLDEEETTDTNGGTGTESPQATQPVEKPVIKPAGNITKPVVDKKAVAQAVVKPVAKTSSQPLAETGSNGAMVLGGSGLLLVLLGALTLRLRRKPRAH